MGLSLGSRWEEKGLSWVMETPSYGQHPDFRLVVVGSGGGLKWTAHAQRLGVREKVLLTGRRSHFERCYAVANCFTLRSETEGLALVTLEAAASGLSLIFAERHAAQGLLEDGVTGFAVLCDPPPLPRSLTPSPPTPTSASKPARPAGSAQCSSPGSARLK